MSGSIIGTVFKVSTFGESHGPALGAIIDGCPAGIPVTKEIIQSALNKRKPGQNTAGSTTRNEDDIVEILSGVFNGISIGTPISLLIRNNAQHSSDYTELEHVFRPGHADYTYQEKYGLRDYRGGGRSSGRETVARVAAGAVALSFLQTVLPNSFKITAYTLEVAEIMCKKRDLSIIDSNPVRACDNEAAIEMVAKIESLRAKGDSLGGIVECCIEGLPTGIGEPVFQKLDAELAYAMLSIGAVKGIEFGAGFNSAKMTGSEWNDRMRIENNSKIGFKSNNAGGILGGISTGNDVLFRIAIKPVPSISLPQETITDKATNTEIVIKGRHDSCLCPRIVPVVEAMTALVLADLILLQRTAVK